MSFKIRGLCFILILMASGLYADTINDQIEAIKNAPPAERVEMMNRLKIEIAAMNEEERANAIDALQKSRGANGNKLQLRLHQGSMKEGGGAMQQLRLHNPSSYAPKRQGRE